MRVTALKYQVKNAERVSVFIDEKYSFSLTVAELLATGLKKGTELSEADIAAYKKLSADGKVKGRAYEWLLGRPHSTQELKDYFYRKKVDPELAVKLMQEFKATGVLSNERYAEWAVERLQRKNKSSRAITAELRRKGIEEETVKQFVGASVEANTTALQQLVAKLRTKQRYQDPKKLAIYLVGKGFSYEEVKKALTLRELEEDF